MRKRRGRTESHRFQEPALHQQSSKSPKFPRSSMTSHAFSVEAEGEALLGGSQGHFVLVDADKKAALPKPFGDFGRMPCSAER